MSDQWQKELLAFIVERTHLSTLRVERILEIHTPEVFPPPLDDVLQAILLGQKLTEEGTSLLTQFGALNSLAQYESELTEEKMLQMDAILDRGRIPDAALDDVPPAFLEYSDIIDKISSQTDENEDTIHQVHRAYLDYILIQTGNPDTVIPFLKYYLAAIGKHKP
ncbi:MAG: hypothetical protein HYR80_09395 [Nitrospirae bacterium]|nr:hypothetical protein [Nitrospirota bacterium]MBI3803134.1 hypothetical protein [Candidatus Manganitrophaceae bacterium]